jgi:hypothetical protein
MNTDPFWGYRGESFTSLNQSDSAVHFRAHWQEPRSAQRDAPSCVCGGLLGGSFLAMHFLTLVY